VQKKSQSITLKRRSEKKKKKTWDREPRQCIGRGGGGKGSKNGSERSESSKYISVVGKKRTRCGYTTEFKKTFTQIEGEKRDRIPSMGRLGSTTKGSKKKKRGLKKAVGKRENTKKKKGIRSKEKEWTGT